MVIPEVEKFGEYVGQFVFVDKPTDENAGEVPIGGCEFDETWPTRETQVYDGQLLDRRQERPIAVDLKVYTNGNKADIEPATHFIIQNTHSCPEGYVGLETETVRRRALAGKPPGPTATRTNASGFGGAVVLASAACGGVITALRRLTGSE